MKKETIIEKERCVLEILAQGYDSSEWGEHGYYNFEGIGQVLENKIRQGQKIPIMFPLEESGRKSIRLACRSLTRKGLAEFQKGLWSDDCPAGAGYGSTRKGAALLNPCDKCDDLAVYDWWENEKGERTLSLKEENLKHIQLCEEHYKSK